MAAVKFQLQCDDHIHASSTCGGDVLFEDELCDIPSAAGLCCSRLSALSGPTPRAHSNLPAQTAGLDDPPPPPPLADSDAPPAQGGGSPTYFPDRQCASDPGASPWRVAKINETEGVAGPSGYRGTQVRVCARVRVESGRAVQAVSERRLAAPPQRTSSKGQRARAASPSAFSLAQPAHPPSTGNSQRTTRYTARWRCSGPAVLSTQMQLPHTHTHPAEVSKQMQNPTHTHPLAVCSGPAVMPKQMQLPRTTRQTQVCFKLDIDLIQAGACSSPCCTMNVNALELPTGEEAGAWSSKARRGVQRHLCAVPRALPLRVGGQTRRGCSAVGWLVVSLLHFCAGWPSARECRGPGPPVTHCSLARLPALCADFKCSQAPKDVTVDGRSAGFVFTSTPVGLARFTELGISYAQ